MIAAEKQEGAPNHKLIICSSTLTKNCKSPRSDREGCREGCKKGSRKDLGLKVSGYVIHTHLSSHQCWVSRMSTWASQRFCSHWATSYLESQRSVKNVMIAVETQEGRLSKISSPSSLPQHSQRIVNLQELPGRITGRV